MKKFILLSLLFPLIPALAANPSAKLNSPISPVIMNGTLVNNDIKDVHTGNIEFSESNNIQAQYYVTSKNTINFSLLTPQNLDSYIDLYTLDNGYDICSLRLLVNNGSFTVSINDQGEKTTCTLTGDPNQNNFTITILKDTHARSV